MLFSQAQSEEHLDGDSHKLSPPKETPVAEKATSEEKIPETLKVSEEIATELPHMDVREVSESCFHYLV